MSSSAAAASRPPKPSSWGSRDMAMKVLVAEQIADSGIALLRREFEVDVVTGLSAEQLVEKIPGYDALIVRSATKATRKIIEAGKNLKIIGRAGVGAVSYT